MQKYQQITQKIYRHIFQRSILLHNFSSFNDQNLKSPADILSHDIIQKVINDQQKQIQINDQQYRPQEHIQNVNTNNYNYNNDRQINQSNQYQQENVKNYTVENYTNKIILQNADTMQDALLIINPAPAPYYYNPQKQKIQFSTKNFLGIYLLVIESQDQETKQINEAFKFCLPLYELGKILALDFTEDDSETIQGPALIQTTTNYDIIYDTSNYGNLKVN
ncbi:hypothetical protein PPERSA_12768 [Pseudocohnilembus persalinus]|uniref:Uncharacterized protein n=1 Tax=Pseudocohnilembus persalinus TaxID=266149 RepID=A0A0V0QTQ7_PSEPJ|nr:hypothetical protein PPERSA_12768 [Pseudocohnilembus persalinus]|eukprot:KRX05590.1 hypothetical protein PPERSA_12768 [Pseudocohnilembus persalinus]